MIDGNTILIAHLGYPTTTFKAPMIYNPYFRKSGINAAVMTMGVKSEDYEGLLRPLFKLTNIRGALVTMPHKVKTVELLDEVTTAVRVSGSCNAILKRSDGSLLGDMFDGEGFVRAVRRKGFLPTGKNILVVGSGGVGSAIAASFAAADVGAIAVYDADSGAMSNLADRIRTHYPKLSVQMGTRDPAGYDLVVNATPLGMNAGDPMPVDVSRISPTTLVGDVVMKQEMTPFLTAANARGCKIQVGIDMLFEQIPAYLEFFGFPSTSPEELIRLAEIRY
jgi:shikimate dehydrogenase